MTRTEGLGTQGFNEAEEYADSLRLQADWAELYPCDKIFDADGFRETASLIDRQAAALPLLKAALEHAREALAWYQGENFEMDGMTVKARIESALASIEGDM
jgi:hypothetical protein